MAIRIRWIDGHVVALCAAKTSPKEGDIYLDDSIHHALSTKFDVDWRNEGLIIFKGTLVDEKIKKLMLAEELKGWHYERRPRTL